jgi:plasmid replication initiation protein
LSLPPEHSIITKSNDLINAHYRLNIFESRIIFLLASMVQPQDMEFKRYTFKAKEIASMLGLTGNSIYVELEKITLSLLKKTFTIKTERENKKDSLLQINWLASAEYIDGVVELEFSPKLKPYFLQLKAKFTSYKLHDVIRLKSIHSFRIYELLKQYQKFGNRTFELEELRELLNVGEDYPRYANFKAKVLLVAQKDIAEKTDMNFDLEEIKKGRSVTKIKFIIYSKIKGDGEINVEVRVDLAGRLENVFGLTSARVQKVMRAHEKEYIENNLLVVEENLYLGKIQKVPAYTQAALKENYA